MNHKWVKKNLVGYIDNILAEDEKKKIDKHLSECPKCKDDFYFLTSVWKSEKTKHEVPEGLWYKIKTDLSERHTVSVIERLMFIPKRYFLAFFLMICIFIGTYLGNKFSMPERSASQDINIAEEYYPTGTIIINNINSGLGR